jgi:hypothetical protein
VNIKLDYNSKGVIESHSFNADSSTATVIAFTMPNLPAKPDGSGVFIPSFTFPGVGKIMTGNMAFTTTSKMLSISPTEGGLG